MTEIRLDVKGDGDNRLKLDWKTIASDEWWYHVDRRALCDRGKTARLRLQDLVDAAMANKPLSVPLKNLARAGADLRERIFSSEPEPDIPGAENWGVEADKWFLGASEAILHLRIDQRVYIPWGLAYDGDPDKLPDEDKVCQNIGTYAGFWCVKYKLSTLYNRIRDSVVKQPRPVSSATRVKLVHQGAWTLASKSLSSEEKALDALLFNHTIDSKDGFNAEWKKKKRNETDLLYVFGHSNGIALEFSKGQVLSIDEFKDNIRRSPPQEKPACIVFMNGCQTVIGDDEKGGFLEATGYMGYCGFIGAEAKIPDVFALRFGNLFLTRLLYSGDRTIHVMHQMRVEHWPLSLVYNLSCHPDFRFTADTPAAAPPLTTKNLSGEPLGSGTV